MQKTLIIGAGLLGLSTAKALHDLGREVEVLDAAEEVGLGASYANGGMLTASMSDPWNSPGVHRHLASSLFDPTSPMKLHLKAIPTLFCWGLKFLRNSTSRRHTHAVQSNYALASYSIGQTRAWREQLDLDYNAAAAGSMKIFRNPSAAQGPLALAKALHPAGLRFHQLDVDGVLEYEPMLHDIRDQITGALYFPGDESGDAHLFCRALKRYLQNQGVMVNTGVPVESLMIAKGRIRGVRTQSKEYIADCVVVAAGTQTPALLKGTGISLSIAPAKGYSVTFCGEDAGPLPTIPVIDDAMHAAISPLGNQLRAVGTAEFTGFDKRLSQVRIDNLVNLLKALYPRIAAQIDLNKAEPWTDFRPMSSDGKPFIGESCVKGLYINSGHGHLGWTKAAGSACLLADLMTARTPAINDKPFAVHR
ncbi:FAD-dependent oxidoreductase [Pseudomaricurvus alkylphenolicus]|uniref:FAD-dependent oxidoreductase n=1 Tax=Pseudomaricurvus alkylphenolicus TaxID=1306991 RepID=UPI001420D513|nr:FAD-dependent oxidoreductase [Pseudomaricurvus alkylphenolicus]